MNLYTYCHNEPIMYTDPTGYLNVGISWVIDGPTTNTSSNIKERMKNEKDPEEKAHLEDLCNYYVVSDAAAEDGEIDANELVVINILEDLVEGKKDTNNVNAAIDVSRNILLGTISSIAENAIDSFNLINTLLWSSTLNIDAATRAYLSIASSKEMFIRYIEKLVTNDVAYYGGRLVADAAILAGGALATVDGVIKVLTGFGVDLASLGITGASLGTTAPVMSLTASAGVALAAVGTIEGGIGLSMMASAFKNGRKDMANFKMAISKGTGNLTTQQKLQNAATNANKNVSGSGTVPGTLKHSDFAKQVRGLNDPSLGVEVSYKNGQIVNYGTSGSVRLDIVEYNADGTIKAVYDLKTGAAGLTQSRIQQIQNAVGTNVPVIEIRP